MNRFEYLLNRVLERTASTEEISEFCTLAKKGDHDDILNNAVAADLKNALTEKDPEDVTIKIERIYKAADYEGYIDKYFSETQVEELNVIPHPATHRLRNWLVAAATVGILILGAGYWLLEDANSQVEISQQTSATKYIGPDKIALPDGSMVELNAGSELSYSDDFGKTSRQVSLSGEAFFDVQHNPSSPFIVNSGKVKTKVLGTAFNVRAFPEEKSVKVTVSRGLVEVASENRIYGQIKPDQQITVDSETDNFVANEVSAVKETSWKDQYFILKDVPMSEAAQMIGERFDVSVAIANQDLQNCRITTKFLNGEQLDYVLTMLCRMTGASYKTQEKTVIIEGGRCR